MAVRASGRHSDVRSPGNTFLSAASLRPGALQIATNRAIRPPYLTYLEKVSPCLVLWRNKWVRDGRPTALGQHDGGGAGHGLNVVLVPHTGFQFHKAHAVLLVSLGG